MTAMKWTISQQDAINSRGDVQVAASAGTGKTAVLSHRCIDLLVDKDNPADIDRILVLTFTEDAAAEMKERIAKTIRTKAAQTHSPHLRRQLLRLDIADISTIHSFCRRLISDNFFRLGVDPDFAIIEGDEQMLLRQEILADVIERAWENAAFSESMKAMLEGRNADLKTGVLKNVYAVDEFMNSLVAPADWAAMCRRGCPDEIDDQYASLLNRRLQVCGSLCRQAAAIDGQLTAGHYAQNLADFQLALDDIARLLTEKRLDEVSGVISALCSMKFKNRPKNSDERDYLCARFPVAEIAKKKILKMIVKEMPSSEVLEAVNSGEVADTAAMLDIVDMFRNEYEKRKKELKCLDFNDLERLALKLLTENSDVAKELCRHYQYIFVDEYQDVNKVQDKIVQLVSAGQNLFIVGDVKQSIYSWRQARPELFLGRIRDAGQSGAKNVYLNENFRCREQIIDFVNVVFGQVMNAEVAGMDYDANAALVFGAKYYLPFEQVCLNPAASPNELHIITSNEESPVQENEDTDDEDEDMTHDSPQQEQSSHRRQAMLIARRVRRLVGGDGLPAELQVVDKRTGGLRAIEYGDIVILLRSVKGRVNDYVDVLRQNNIPVDASAAGSYFESPEVGDCLSILKVIDNPMRDVELAAAMRSPVFGFSDCDLLAVRQAADPNNMPFYNCVLQSAAGVDELAVRITAMLSTMDKWRNMASRSRLAEVIWQILRHNDFLSFASALPGGLQKRADLLKLHERAVQFEGFISTQGNPSLGRFVDFVERLRDSEGDWSQAEADVAQSGSVRIISIHKSKGLEYPVVFLAGMEKGFNTADTKQMCLLDEQLPMGLKVYIDSRGNDVQPNCFNVIKQKKYQSMIAEEMRTLYVAMTRAREKLIIVADTKSKDKTGRCGYLLKLLDELKLFTETAAFNWWLSDCGSRSYLDWIAAALRSEPDICGLLSSGGRAAGLLDVFVTDADELICDEQTAAAPLTAIEVDPQMIDVLKEHLTRQYAYQGVLSLPVKNSVSKITHRDDEYKMDFFTAAIDDADLSHTAADSPTPDPRTVGTATHLVFENLPLDKKPQPQDVHQVVEMLKKRGAITAQVAAMINIEQVLSFFDTEPGRLLFAEGVKVYREYPFTIGLSPKDCGFTADGQDMGDNIIVQGIIDLLLITPEGMVVVDFKTDNITAAGIDARADIYKRQLRLYSYAVSRILKRSVAAQWLYFLKPMTARRC